MRVLFWSGTFWPHIGGVEVMASKLLPALRERGHDYLVVTPKLYPSTPDQEQYKGIPIHRFPFWSVTNYNDIEWVMELRQRVAELKRSFAPHLIHINAVGRGDFFHLTTKNAHPAPLLVTIHGEWSNFETGPQSLVEQTLRAADWVTGCSAAILDEGRRLAPEISSRSSVIYNGLEPPPLELTRLPFDPPRLLCLGRLWPEKGFDLALAAFGSILPRFPDARLVIAGDGPAQAELEQQAARQGLRHAVDFLGWVAPDEVPALINECTIMLMPSRRDSLPLVALEAALMARPLVATRVGGLPEIVVHEQTGILVEPEHADDLARALTLLLEHPDVAERIGHAARRHVLKTFGFERQVEAYDMLYQRLTRKE